MPRAKYKPKQKPAAWWIERQRAVARKREALAMREREGLRKRYQSDLLQFWRRCPDTRCRRKRTCKGVPDGCLGRGLAAMSAPDREWLRGAIVATVKGARSMEELVRGTNEEIAAARSAKPMDVQELAARLGQLLADPAGPLPSRQDDEQADDEARVVVPEHKSPASPDTGREEPALPAAGPPPSAEASRTGSLDQPRHQPQDQGYAYCDEEGRLIIPDRTEYNERLRRGLTWSEIVQRGRV
jgi:hypothetical protein